MKKRLIRRQDIARAYTQDQDTEKLELNMDSAREDVDKLPKEIFQILGEVLSFIESTNKFKEDQNEDK